MKLIKLNPGGNVYPYELEQFKRDNPSFNFPDNLEGVDLGIFDVAEVIEAPYPQYDRFNQNLEPLMPELIDGVWTIQWSLRDLTAEEIKERAPVDWPGFNFWLFTNQSFISYGLAANSVNPYLVPAIIERYGQIAKVGLIESGFPGYWNNFCQSLVVSQEHRDEWANKAAGYNLPNDFISVVRSE